MDWLYWLQSLSEATYWAFEDSTIVAFAGAQCTLSIWESVYGQWPPRSLHCCIWRMLFCIICCNMSHVCACVHMTRFCSSGSLGSATGHSGQRPAECTTGHSAWRLYGVDSWEENRASGLQKLNMHVHTTSCMQIAQLRHSQPEFHAKNLRDAGTGYAEMAMKAYNDSRR